MAAHLGSMAEPGELILVTASSSCADLVKYCGDNIDIIRSEDHQIDGIHAPNYEPFVRMPTVMVKSS